jgi:DNA adenine methylase
MFPYIGGKRLHTRWIDPLVEVTDCDTYVEVFGGAMWVYWQSKKLPLTTNVYNDFNRDLYNVFTCASTDPQKFEAELLALYPHMGSAHQYEQFRDEIFSTYNTGFTAPDYDRGAKYMFLQTQFFSGGAGLTEKTKIYVAPNYKNKFKTYVEKFKQPKYLEKLAELSTENMDCRQLIAKYDSPTAFFYIDPPYFNLEDYYTKNEFGYDDHIELLTQMKSTKGRWALSYYYFDELEELLPRDQYYWHEERTIANNGLKKVEDAKRADGTSAKGVRPERTEVLILNYQPTEKNIVEIRQNKKKPVTISIVNNNLFEFE